MRPRMYKTALLAALLAVLVYSAIEADEPRSELNKTIEKQIFLAQQPSPETQTDQGRIRLARALVKDYLAPIVSSPRRDAPYRLFDCNMRTCRFEVRGAITCRGVMQMREDPNTWWVWATRLDCR